MNLCAWVYGTTTLRKVAIKYTSFAIFNREMSDEEIDLI